MNITRENLGELDLSIKVDIAENDYAEKVAKQLKEYQHKATVPGFRKGMAPMALIQRIYKSAVVADTVQDLLGESLYKYIDDEKLDIIGSPLSNEEKTGAPDFANGKDFTFYFDAALFPDINIEWDKIDAKLYSIKVTAKDVDSQIESIAERYGKFESPEAIVEGAQIYGKAVELTKEGTDKEGGVSTFCSFKLSDIKDSEVAKPPTPRNSRATSASKSAVAPSSPLPNSTKNFSRRSSPAKTSKSSTNSAKPFPPR